MNPYMEIDRYMKNAILKGCLDENVLVNRAWRNVFYSLSENQQTQEKMLELIRWAKANLMIIKEEVRKAGEDFKKIDLKVVRERLMERMKK